MSAGKRETAQMLHHLSGQTEPGQLYGKDRVPNFQYTTTRAHGQIELARG